jgi:hypothetical protein
MRAMAIKKHILLFCLLLSSCLLIAQTEDYTDFKKGQPTSPAALIQQAKALKDKEPTQAIKLADEAIKLIRQSKEAAAVHQKKQMHLYC